MRPHLEGESPQCRNGNQDGHEESNHVVDGCQRDTGARAPQTLTHTLLPGQNRDSQITEEGAQKLGREGTQIPPQSTFVRYYDQTQPSGPLRLWLLPFLYGQMAAHRKANELVRQGYSNQEALNHFDELQLGPG